MRAPGPNELVYCPVNVEVEILVFNSLGILVLDSGIAASMTWGTALEV